MPHHVQLRYQCKLRAASFQSDSCKARVARQHMPSRFADGTSLPTREKEATSVKLAHEKVDGPGTRCLGFSFTLGIKVAPKNALQNLLFAKQTVYIKEKPIEVNLIRNKGPPNESLRWSWLQGFGWHRNVQEICKAQLSRQPCSTIHPRMCSSQVALCQFSRHSL